MLNKAAHLELGAIIDARAHSNNGAVDTTFTQEASMRNDGVLDLHIEI